MTRTTTIDHLDWDSIAVQLDQEGYAVLPDLLCQADAGALARLPGTSAVERHVSLEADDMGRGDEFVMAQPLPEWLLTLCTALHAPLAHLANSWNEALGVPHRHALHQGTTPVLTFNRLREGGYQCLRQRAEGEHMFPLQLIALLSEPGVDFTGGEFVMVEQRPRMQSRPLVLPLKRGDMAIIPTARRPVKGSSGRYQVNMKHAISSVLGGERIGLECLYRCTAESS